MRAFQTKGKSSGGFTLIELLLVITIISVLAAVAVPRFFGRSREARVVAARETIVGSLGVAMDLFEQDTGRYPTSEEGLMALIQNPQVVNWRGPYIKSATVPLDPWGNPYRYAYPSQLTSSPALYDLISGGPDGTFGSQDDITNHNAADYGQTAPLG
jgi:general secretion pathway protein G